MLDRWVEENGLLDAMNNQSGTICFSPLAQGLLTSRYLDGNIPEGSRASENRFLKADSITKERVALLNELNEVAKRRGQSLSELAISWLLKDERITSVLIGASSKAQLLQNLRALDKPSTFSSEELSELDAVLEKWV
jgi:L-glyceraldehyde 3-phosphate reductase